MEDPNILYEQVRDQKTFIAFLKALSEEEAKATKLLTENPEEYKYGSVLGWENGGIANYLEAISACLEDGKGFETSAKLNWKELADIFYIGKFSD